MVADIPPEAHSICLDKKFTGHHVCCNVPVFDAFGSCIAASTLLDFGMPRVCSRERPWHSRQWFLKRLKGDFLTLGTFQIIWDQIQTLTWMTQCWHCEKLFIPNVWTIVHWPLSDALLAGLAISQLVGGLPDLGGFTRSEMSTHG